METIEVDGKKYKRLPLGSIIPEGTICEYNLSRALRNFDAKWHSPLWDGRWHFPSCNVGRKHSHRGNRYWVPVATPNEEADMIDLAKIKEATQDILPTDDTDFSMLFTPAFNKWVNDVVDKRVDALLCERLDSYVEREVGSQLDSKLEDEVRDILDNACLEDHFNIEACVSDALSDTDLSDYIDDAAVEETVQRFLDNDTTIEFKVQSTLKDILSDAADGL